MRVWLVIPFADNAMRRSDDMATGNENSLRSDMGEGDQGLGQGVKKRWLVHLWSSRGKCHVTGRSHYTPAYVFTLRQLTKNFDARFRQDAARGFTLSSFVERLAMIGLESLDDKTNQVLTTNQTPLPNYSVKPPFGNDDLKDLPVY